MTQDEDLHIQEEFERPTLTDEQERTQRGKDPSTVRHDPKPREPERNPDLEPRREQVRALIDRLVRENGRVRQEGLWPYLLIRYKPGDYGVRPTIGPRWESPDIIVVPGIVETYDGISATLSPQVGFPHSIFVHVWNLGRLPAIGVRLQVHHAPIIPDTSVQSQLIGSAYINLSDRRNSDCHKLVRVPGVWIPSDGWECLIAKVDHFADNNEVRGDQGLNNRRFAMRSLYSVEPSQNITPLLTMLDQNLPKDTDLNLIHGMNGLQPTLLIHQPSVLGKLTTPTALPKQAYELADRSGHLGAVLRGAINVDRFAPASIIGPMYDNGRFDAKIIQHAEVKDIKKTKGPAIELLRRLGVEVLTGRNIAKQLGGRPDDGHMLRFQAVRDGQVVGGFTLIVHQNVIRKKKELHRQTKRN
jgi:hypothetical protein